MSSPQWKFTPTKPSRVTQTTHLPVNKHVELDITGLIPQQEDQSPSVREKMQKDLINRFKQNVNNLKESLSNASHNKMDALKDFKHKELIFTSFIGHGGNDQSNELGADDFIPNEDESMRQ